MEFILIIGFVIGIFVIAMKLGIRDEKQKNEIENSENPPIEDTSTENNKKTIEVFTNSIENANNKFCIHCGTELQNNQKFCGQCGRKTVKPSEKPLSEGAKKVIVLWAIAVIIIPFYIIAIYPDFERNLSDNSYDSVTQTSTNFADMYSDLRRESWCKMGDDGTWMKIDTNPYNIKDYFSSDADYKIERVLSDLDFPSYVFEEMGATRALDGRQSAETDKYEVSWSYHPDNGLEVLFKIKSND